MHLATYAVQNSMHDHCCNATLQCCCTHCTPQHFCTACCKSLPLLCCQHPNEHPTQVRHWSTHQKGHKAVQPRKSAKSLEKTVSMYKMAAPESRLPLFPGRAPKCFYCVLKSNIGQSKGLRHLLSVPGCYGQSVPHRAAEGSVEGYRLAP